MDLNEWMNNQLFSREDEHAYAVLDGASIPDLLDRLYGDDRPEFECLYRGELPPDMAEVAPYLVELTPDSAFAGWVIEKGWGQHWGIFAVAPADLRLLRQHFRRLNVVYGPEHKPLIFRYYDPRVLRGFAPTCDATQLAEFFGPIRCFILENDDPGHALRLSRAEGKLRQETTPVDLGVRSAQGA
ncbi:MAG: DUF4123 domain-containing protein [Candidatus Eisenbacteria bacterium]|nr:DUF4123 domain-containing protein [Candidatus Eisenbacteria bacterium]